MPDLGSARRRTHLKFTVKKRWWDFQTVSSGDLRSVRFAEAVLSELGFPMRSWIEEGTSSPRMNSDRFLELV
jgi:hypothetical protein